MSDLGLLRGTAWGAITAASIVLAGASGCSVLTSADADQCSTSADCEAKGFAGYTCSAERVCVSGGLPTVGPEVDGQAPGCQSDDQCVAANGGRPALCPTVGGQCVNLATDSCQITGSSKDAFKDRNAIFVGWLGQSNSIYPNVSSSAIFGGKQVKLAFNEIVATLPQGGLPFGPNGARRPLVLAECVWGDDPADGAAVAAHLANVIKPEALIADADSDQSALVGAYAQRNTAMFEFCAQCYFDGRRINAGTGDLGNIYVNGPTTDEEADAMVAKVTAVDAELHAQPGFTGDVRVAFITTNPSWCDIKGEHMKPLLRFNGKDISQQPQNFLHVKYKTNDGDISGVAQQVAAFAPHIVVTVATRMQYIQILPLIEALHPAGAPKPLYVMTESFLWGDAKGFVGVNEDRRKRSIGYLVDWSNFIPNGAEYDSFVSRYRIAYPGTSDEDVALPMPYDAMYEIVYSMVGARTPASGRYTAAELTAGLKKLQTGTLYYPGPGSLTNAIAELINVGNIHVSGLGFDLAIDFTKGYSPTTRVDALCLSRETGSLDYKFDTGESWDVATSTLQGTFSCP